MTSGDLSSCFSLSCQSLQPSGYGLLIIKQSQKSGAPFRAHKAVAKPAEKEREINMLSLKGAKKDLDEGDILGLS